MPLPRHAIEQLKAIHQKTSEGRVAAVLTVDECRQIEPSLEAVSDQEVLAIRDALYERAAITLDIWQASLRRFQISRSGLAEGE